MRTEAALSRQRREFWAPLPCLSLGSSATWPLGWGTALCRSWWEPQPRRGSLTAKRGRVQPPRFLQGTRGSGSQSGQGAENVPSWSPALRFGHSEVPSAHGRPHCPCLPLPTKMHRLLTEGGSSTDWPSGWTCVGVGKAHAIDVSVAGNTTGNPEHMAFWERRGPLPLPLKKVLSPERHRLGEAPSPRPG